MTFKTKNALNYIYNTPKTIRWRVIAGGELSEIQSYDLVYDNYDLKIRQLEIKWFMQRR